MSNVTLITKPVSVMNSLDLLKVINQYRLEDGKPEMRHDNFMNKIEDELKEDALKFQGVYIGGNGEERKCYNLPKRECHIMGMRESSYVRSKTYDYIESLEKPKELSRMDILQIAMDAEKENNVLRIENHQQSEKIDKLENYFQSGMTIAAFGRTLNGVNCSQITTFCSEELKWLYNESKSGRNKRWRAYSVYRDRYLTETPVKVNQHGIDPFTKHEPKLLADGAKKLYELYLAEKLPMKKTWNGEFVHYKFDGEAA